MSIITFNILCYIWISLAIIVHIVLFFVTAPFGRHTSDKWGLSMNNKAAWLIMELPSLLIMIYFLIVGSKSFLSYSYILFCLWIIHYFNRAMIYPFRIKSTSKKMPLLIVFNALLFNAVNAMLNGYYLSELVNSSEYNSKWLVSANFTTGLLLFISGFIVNNISDTILIKLRKPGDSNYKIPYGFLFKYISAPNLFGEIIEWCGFALMAWNLPALTFMIWTYANLVPRAKNHHEWYLKNFANYPSERKIIFPYLY